MILHGHVHGQGCVKTKIWIISFILFVMICIFEYYLFNVSPSFKDITGYPDKNDYHDMNSVSDGYARIYKQEIISQQISIQVVIVSVTISCIVKNVINGLLLFGTPRPNKIRVIVPEHVLVDCQKMSYEFLPEVKCYSEYDLLPLNISTLKKWFISKGWIDLIGSRRPGWYLQQLLKLQAAQFWANELDEYYLIWDADMILIKKYNFFLLESESGSEYKLKMRVNIGGYPPYTYVKSTKLLTGLSLEPSYNWICNNCTTHQMLVKKSIMIEILTKIADGNSSLNGVEFSKKLIDKIPKNVTDIERALSEYNIYYEYSLFYYPDLFKIDSIIRFQRYRLDKTKHFFFNLYSWKQHMSHKQKCKKLVEFRNKAKLTPNIHYIGMEEFQD